MRLANCRKFPQHQYSPISHCTDAQIHRSTDPQCTVHSAGKAFCTDAHCALHSTGKAKKAEVTEKLEARGDVDGDDPEDKLPKSLHPGLAQSGL